MRETIVLLHPGAMGSVLGGLLTDRSEVRWVADGRSPATAERAEAAGLTRCEALGEALDGATIVLSICPPDRALEVARAVAGAGFGGRYVDANAVAPATAREVAAAVTPARFVDGGIVGPPPTAPDRTRLYLSGPEADGIAALFAGTAAETIVLDGGPGSASALKAAYASTTKGVSALLLAVRAFAEREGVAEALAAELARSGRDTGARIEGALRTAPAKAWRFAGELRELGDAFAHAGLPGGFGHAAGDVYERLSAFRDRTDVDPADVLAALLAPPD